jgi:2-keto-4-pentenoate hydratase/2-oxohepta-3-ene-1,7-dioic acid hydratase in catechol pathway
VELAVLVGQELRMPTPNAARQAVAGYGIALDLTLRDCAKRIEEERSSLGNRQSVRWFLPLSPFLKPEALAEPQATDLSAAGERRSPPAGQHPIDDGRHF